MNIKKETHQSIRNINQVFIALLLLLIISSFVFCWLSWREEKADQVHNLQSIMELGEKAIDAYFTQLENGMLGLIQDIIQANDQIDLDHAFILVKRFKESHPELTNITFIREDGQILFTAKTPPDPKLPTLALEPSFIQFRGEPNQDCLTSIGQPLEGLVTNIWIIPIRFLIHDKEGKLAYIISANLPVEFLQNYWKDAPFTKTAALGLMRDDGFLIGRYPIPVNLEMTNVYGVPRTGALINYLRQEKFPTYGFVEGPSSLDGPNHLNAFSRLEHFPITLFIAMPMSEILTRWWNKVKIPNILSGVLLIGVFLISQWTFRRECVREEERRLVRQTLRESEERFRNLFEQNAAVMLMIDPDTGKIIQVNKAAADFYGRSIEKLMQMHIQQINILPPEAVKSEMENVLSSGATRLEFRHQKADGSIRNVEVYCNKMEINGKVLLYSIVHDITERKQAEEALLVIIAEKDMLLKEVHHRVKNNLAVIIGLMDLQGQTISDEPARIALAELDARIKSMAMIHEQLYQSDDFSHIDFQAYLEELCVYLRSAYHTSGDISISVSAVGVEMGLDIAVPCGLLITELVTNSYKHGFPTSWPCTGADGCKIDVSAQWDGVAYTLAVADNGVGLPAGLDWMNAKTLGLVLVNLLGQHQLQGQIELDRTGGTTFRLRFAPSKG